eukprot:TRINITY_DN33506_c2_g1_i1.p1 TRINITY_DN33506_c2_g1~~TRINITY_DN33506_c2_g1_i1.p1  ORF type:complete len:164 (+),score=11.26 TRINITY_DN33506_c2_g1_i1:338-829(+)
MEKGEISLIKFNVTNYTSWGFQFQIYLKGKELRGHVDGSDPKPINDMTNSKAVIKRKTKDAQTMTWILGSVEPQYILNLTTYKIAKGMWEYLKQVYQQENSAHRFQLDHELFQFAQGTMSIQKYYSQFIRLWIDYTKIIDLVYQMLQLQWFNTSIQPLRGINS